MNKKIISIALLISTLFGLSSCLKDEDDTTYYDDTAITSFKLGTLKSLTDTTSTGAAATVDCSSINFHIDQVNHLIYNTDSLPAGLNLQKSLCTIVVKNNGVVGFNSDVEGQFLPYYSTDSLDFSKPRTVRVISSSGLYYQDYTLTVNMHKEVADSFSWKANVGYETLKEMTDLRGFSAKDSVYIFGQKNGAAVVLCGSVGSLTTWSEKDSPLSVEGYRGLVSLDQKFYTLQNGQVIRLSSVFGTKEVVTSVPQLKQMVGASRKNLYALSTDNHLFVSTDKGATWTEETLDADASLLPVADISLVAAPMKGDAQYDRIVLFGKNAAGKHVLWNKIAGGNNSQSWMYMEYADENKYQFSDDSRVLAVDYDESLAAFDGTKMYKSLDQGRTWHKDGNIAMPASFTSNAKEFAFFTDENGFIWVLTNGTVWKGLLNKMGWK